MTNHILIVDDNEMIRRSVLELFRHDKNAVCSEAKNGLEAIERTKEFNPNLVIIDYAMPVMDGLQATPHLKSINPDLRIVMLTAFKDKGLEMKAYRAGVTWVLSKTEDNITKVRDFARILLRPDFPLKSTIPAS
jgi:two-component system chemotaxis response regulator CheY